MGVQHVYSNYTHGPVIEQSELESSDANTSRCTPSVRKSQRLAAVSAGVRGLLRPAEEWSKTGQVGTAPKV